MNQKLKISIFVFILIHLNIITVPTSAQITFERIYGSSDFELPFSVKQTSDGGYLAAGMYNDDGWLIRLNEFGDSLWTKQFGDTGSENIKYLESTFNNEFIMVGETNSFGAGSYDVWLVKIDLQGNIIWSKTIGGYNGDSGYCVKQTADSGFVIAAQTSSLGPYSSNNIWLIKTDSEGDTIWTKVFGDNSEDRGYHVQQTFDGGYILTGLQRSTNPGATGDLFLAKTDQLGNALWQTTISGSSSYQNGRSVIQTQDSNYVVVGVKDNIWLLKFNQTGDTLWTKTYEGWAADFGQSVQETNDGGLIITGMSVPDGVDSGKVCLIKTDVYGNVIWRKEFSELGFGMEVIKTQDGGFLVAGAGRADLNLFVSEAYFIKTNSEGLITNINNTGTCPDYYRLLQNFPNPFNPTTKITYSILKTSFVKLNIYDLLGREVTTLVIEENQPGNHEVEFDATDLASGVYLYRMQAGDFVQTKKMILLK